MPFETVVPCTSVNDDLPFWQSLGLRLDAIWPADDPQVALLSGDGVRLRVERADHPAPHLRLTTRDPDLLARRTLTSPGGVAVVLDHSVPPMATPEPVAAPMIRRLADSAPWVIGRAGMHYRDLVPDRLGGAMIASHIRIPEGGPVPDMVHYHTVGFQLIFCLSGWVDLVYEDQGDPFRLHAGDAVTQPPEIRHRVLHASDGLEVLEIGAPADHVTTIDHDLRLPNGTDAARRFAGQRFVRHRADAPWRADGAQHVQETGIGAATGGVAEVRVVRGAGPIGSDAVTFGFVRAGEAVLALEGDRTVLGAGDAFVLPPGRSADLRDGAETIEVALRA
ncbi:cupin domain-containing protein [Jannaschia sp. Os4]|uniref:cupin domain-containing protein n=1 Tax=Jannaschia sp. Os4 TaxID=2807617 RepID=UPI00193A1163|nr:cupin domain-containing protein [Jannaschia sp. Os4]MBM2576736.1 cupin domain-containing protein [Jannaschia sp. Os4]